MKNKQVLIVSSLNTISPANYVIDAFVEMNFSVIAISDVENPRADLICEGAFDVAQYLTKSKHNPDYLLFVEGGEMGIFPVNYGNLNIPAIWWGIDTHNDYQKHLRISRLFDHTFIAQKSFVDCLGADGIHAVSWLPLAYPRRTIQNSQREIDIAYVGSTNWSMYPERGLLLESIAENFENVLIKECLPSEMFEIYERSKIVFNFSPMNDVNMRFFEALGSGAVLITNPIFNNGIEEIFSTNIDFVEYQSSEHLISLIKNLLADPKEMLEISSNGVTKVREHHTYHNRCIDIAQTFKQIDPDNRKVSNLDTSAALISMNMLAPALKYFFKAIRGESTGKRSRIMLLILNPVFISLVTIFSFIEFVLRQFRKTKW